MERIGNCRIVGEIGSGGMAYVYKAVQEPLGRTVAIKALKPTIAVESQFAIRFEREAHFMASLQHENILHVYDFVKDGRSMYIVMEYVEGIDLYDLLERTPVLPSDVAAIIALQVARALDYAHFRGIIHRDIKPANIMISHTGEVKLMDFGIARDDRLSDLTQTGTGLGTPSYMSPEQILGDKLDSRSDVFSLGIVLYQMLTGNKPFVEDEARTVMQKIRLDRYTPARKVKSGIPRFLERILARQMQKMPANRYPTTQALIDDLVEFLAPRVPINHNARLVFYLRDIGEIDDAQADKVLTVGATRSLRQTDGGRGVLKHIALAMGVICIAIVAGGLGIQAASGRFSDDEMSGEAAAEAPLSIEQAARVRFIVEPWAEVSVDGERMTTTPTSEVFRLAPGNHFVRFENPYCEPVQQELRVRAGEEKLVEVTLEPLAPEGQP